MKITIECNKAEQAEFINDLAQSEDFCIFGSQCSPHCAFGKTCDDCILENIEWKITNNRVCYSCGKEESPENLLNIRSLPYIGKDVLLCGDCLASLITKGIQTEKQFGGFVANDND